MQGVPEMSADSILFPMQARYTVTVVVSPLFVFFTLIKLAP